MTTTLTVAGYNSSDVVLKSRAAWLHLMIYFTLTRVNSRGFLRFLLSTFAAYMYMCLYAQKETRIIKISRTWGTLKGLSGKKKPQNLLFKG